MARWAVFVEAVADGRFAIMRRNVEQGPGEPFMQGPDGGEDNKGYTIEELPSVLGSQYGLSISEIAACMPKPKA
ncbi:hypothetical protein [Acidisoma sp. S159]|uniref:hypothetical protein n=1 Tax=Acidisoma sp. S159 TaxID=1747225 RepID=UPI00131D1C85|nr:hypothetical protein [Acidisoma sp. S159]